MIATLNQSRPDREERIDRAIAEWFEELERGTCRGHHEFLRRHADISKELSAFLRDYVVFQRLSAGVARRPD